jgi:aldose 1-epimerase
MYLEGEVQLASGNATALISPRGAALTELIFAGNTVVQHATISDVRDSFSGVTLAPWPNRLAGAKWNFGGKALLGVANDQNGNANHGLVFDRDFEVLSKTENAVVLALADLAAPVYPFEVSVEVSFELRNFELISNITLTNNGEVEVPVAFGAHPYIRVSAKSEIIIQAQKQMINNSAQLPIGSETATKHLPRIFSDLNLDDCFFDLNTNAAGSAVTKIIQTDGSEISLWQDSSFKYLMAYTHPTLGIALEPQTAPANAFNTETDLIWLGPGESASGAWGITFKNEGVK